MYYAQKRKKRINKKKLPVNQGPNLIINPPVPNLNQNPTLVENKVVNKVENIKEKDRFQKILEEIEEQKKIEQTKFPMSKDPMSILLDGKNEGKVKFKDIFQ